MLSKDLFKLGSRVVIEGTKVVTLGAGVSLVSQGLNLAQSGDYTSIKELGKALDVSLDALLK